MQETPEIMRGVQYYIDEIRKAGLYEQIPHFNDLLTGRSKPDSIQPILENIKLGGKTYDIYHWGGTSARIYLHKKD